MRTKGKVVAMLAVIVAVFALSMVQITNLFEKIEDQNYYRYSKSHSDEEETKELYIVKKDTLKPGTYVVEFDYTVTDDVTFQVNSVAEYDFDTDYYKIYQETIVPAGENLHGRYEFELESEVMMASILLFSEDEFDIVLENIKVESTDPCYTDVQGYTWTVAVFVVAFLAVIGYILISSRVKNKKHSAAILLALTALCLIASSIYLTKATPGGHDIVFHIRRVEGLAESILAGEIPQRMNTVFNAGYGYINPVMYPELFLYLPAVLICLGMSSLAAIKIFYIVVNTATVLISFYSFKKMSDNDILSVCLSAVYSLSFYRMQNVYLRGAMGESLFMVFFPLAAYGLYTIMYKEHKRWFLFALAVSAIIQSHILGTLFTAIFLAIEFVVFAADLLIKKQFKLRIIVECIKSVITTLLINLWFLVPFLFYYLTQKFMMFDKSVQIKRFYKQLIPLKSMFSFDMVTTNIIENMGILVMAAVAVMLCMYIRAVVKDRANLFVYTAMIIVAALYCLLCTDVFPWEQLSKISIVETLTITIQFAFRFYGSFILVVCMFIAIAGKNLKKSNWMYLVMIVAVIVSAFSTENFAHNDSINLKDARYSNYYYDAPNEYLNEGAEFAPLLADPQKLKASENIIIKDYSKNRTDIHLSIEKTDNEEGSIILPLLYYYGYEAVTDSGELLTLISGEYGGLTCIVDSSDVSEIFVSFKTDAQKFRYPEIVSVISVVLCTLYAITEYIILKKKKNL